ncbi:MAG: pyruvate:ferredoxin (flavodoxin) oxidoreductase [bacterium]|nr:pyruvate:ferredoxin (flavodoxin) oxidoreductase [bacterium]
MARRMVTIDGNEAAAYVAHQTNEIIAIYPITPSSPMAELADEWSEAGQTNIWGIVPVVNEMQSEKGAAAAIHGALQAGALSTTFTASQGLLLMIPNMYKIAGELTPTVFHIAARSIACQALSIFGDHSDVMAARATGFALLASGSVQEAMDLALIAQAATLESRVPFLHFFDGFRTSHEINKIEQLSRDDFSAMINDDLVLAHRSRALSPDNPFIRGTSQNPDVYFQSREAANPYYLACPDIVQKTMDRFADLVGRHYHLFDYHGASDAELIIVLMGSGAEVVQETVDWLVDRGERVGLVRVHLYRPFSIRHFIKALPASTKTLAVLDRTKEPGSIGEPLYLDVIAAVYEAIADGTAPFSSLPKIIGGRYGIGSKEFTPAMILGLFEEMKKDRPKNHFTLGINDDLTHTSIDYDPSFTIESEDTIRAIFYGLGADGTVSANKNSIKIIGEGTDNYAQGYFVYDSKKAGSVTISHLRFGKKPIHSSYLIQRANFIACHQPVFLERYDMLSAASEGATFLLNSPAGPDKVWDTLPRSDQQQLIDKKMKFYTIDAFKVAKECQLGVRINTIMQTCFFAISGVLPRDEAIAKIKEAIWESYGKKGEEIVQMNFKAVDHALANLYQVPIPDKVTATFDRPPILAEEETAEAEAAESTTPQESSAQGMKKKPLIPKEAPEFVRRVVAKIIAGRGDELPVSAMPADGTYPSGTSQYEKRNIALQIPVWDPEVCIQCNCCSFVCPHATIRTKVYDPQYLAGAPKGFKSADYKGKDFAGMKFTVQVAPEDCTGCGLCVQACPAKNKKETRLRAINLYPQLPRREEEAKNYEFFLSIPDPDRTRINISTVKGVQFLQPLFEYSGACAGCGETQYLRLISQLFGDRAVIGNATGCSSIYGGNLPTTPWTKNSEGRGPAWNNPLFEDNAEFGFGLRLAIDKHTQQARALLQRLAGKVGDRLASAILEAPQNNEREIADQRERVKVLREKLKLLQSPEVRHLESLADYLVKKVVWIVGGDGWAYDIDFDGLDHVLAAKRNVNLLVLDTEVYSNTGGQMSKATPRAAVAKFAAGGKYLPKKDLAMMAMSYGYVYVAKVAFGADDQQTVKALVEAEQYDGPSMIIAYCHCIGQGINTSLALTNQKAAVNSGYWNLFRFNPDRLKEGLNPLILDSKPPQIPLEEYAYLENRYKMLTKTKPDEARRLLELAQRDVNCRFHIYEQLAKLEYPPH